jgi:hypothetical protein
MRAALKIFIRAFALAVPAPVKIVFGRQRAQRVTYRTYGYEVGSAFFDKLRAGPPLRETFMAGRPRCGGIGAT